MGLWLWLLSLKSQQPNQKGWLSPKTTAKNSFHPVLQIRKNFNPLLSLAFGSKKLPTYQVMRIPIRSFLFMLKDRYTIIKAPKSIRRLTRRATRNLCTLIGAISDADCRLTTTTEALLLMLVLNFQRGTVSARHSCSDIRNYQKRKIDEMCMDTVWPTSFVIP